MEGIAIPWEFKRYGAAAAAYIHNQKKQHIKKKGKQFTTKLKLPPPSKESLEKYANLRQALLDASDCESSPK